MGKTSTAGSSTWGFTYLVAEIIMGFAFWSLINEYVATLWFFPLNRMAFSGMEAYLAGFFVVFILAFSAVRSFALSYASAIRVIAYSIGLLSFIPYDLRNPIFPFTLFNHKDPNTGRLPMVSFAVVLGEIAILRLWWSSNAERRYRSLWGFLLGLVLMLIVRMEFLTLNPITVWTKAIFLGIGAVIWAGYTLGREKWPVEEAQKVSPTGTSSSLVSGSALGSLLFLTFMMFSTHGTVARHLELNPFPSGILIVLSVIAGIIVSGKIHRIGTKNWLCVGLIGMSLFILGEDGDGGFMAYVGLVGGAIFSMYTISIWPTIISNFANSPRLGLASFMQAFFFVFFVFWSVWVVAYKFVPWWLGALLLRERNRTLLLALMLVSSAGFVEFGSTTKPKDEERNEKGEKKRGLPTAISERLPRWEVVLVLGIMTVAIFFPVVIHRFLRVPTNPQPNESGAKPTPINGMIWNIHFGYDNFGRNNFEDVAVAIKERNINVVGLLESDLSRIITGNRDFVEFLEVELNMYSDFGPSSAKSTWGCGLLSAFPIQSAKHIVLPSPEGELACLIDAVLLVDDKPVNVLVTHFGNTEDALDRQLQTDAMAEMVKQQTLPVIVLSYITDRPRSKNYWVLIEYGGLKDTTTDMNRYCEYIFYKGLDLVKFERWNGGTLSDTEAQYATWTLPQN